MKPVHRRRTIPDAAGFVLAGGRSSRMGSDKALLELCGQPLVALAVTCLCAADLEVSIAGSKSALERFAPVIEDADPDRGPLGGICTALAATTKRWAVFLPVDMPFLPPVLIRWLFDCVQEGDAAAGVCSLEGRAETFPAVVDRDVLPVLREELENGRGSCIAGFRAAAAALHRPMLTLPVEGAIASGTVEILRGATPERWFLNVNTQEDLRRASDGLV